MKTQQLTTPISGSISVSQALREFRLHQRTSRHTAKTLAYYDYSLGKFEAWLVSEGIEHVERVDAGCIRLFMLGLQDTLKPNSVHGIMRAVRALFNFLMAEDLLLANPMAKVKMPKTDKTLMPAFTEAEISKLLKVTEGKEIRHLRNRALLLLLLDSGLRLAECASLFVRDVDLETGMIRVIGKGRKERVTKLGSNALRALHRYLRHRGDLNGSEALWVGERGNMTAAGLAETVEKLGKAAGVHANPHKFRRTCALMLLRNGADVFSVQYLLGHSDLAVMRRYLAQTDADISAAHVRFSPVDKLN